MIKINKIIGLLFLLLHNTSVFSNEIDKTEQKKINVLIEYYLKKGMYLQTENKKLVEIEETLKSVIDENKKLEKEIVENNKKIKTMKQKKHHLIDYKVKSGDNLFKIIKKTFPPNYLPTTLEIKERLIILKQYNPSINKTNVIHLNQNIKVPLFKN